MIETKEDAEINALKAEAILLQEILRKTGLIASHTAAARLFVVQARLIDLIEGQLRVYIQASNRFIQTLNGVPVP